MTDMDIQLLDSSDYRCCASCYESSVAKNEKFYDVRFGQAQFSLCESCLSSFQARARQTLNIW